MNIETIPIEKLITDPANVRKHSEKNLDAIRGSLLKFGQQKPIVVDKGGIVLAGNGTLTAAKALGWKNIDVVRTELNGPEAIAFAIADNRTSELAEWDDDSLSKTLEALNIQGFDLGQIGFNDEDLAQWLKLPEAVPGCDEDEVPEVRNPVTKPGDLWLLGGHRLLCGDSKNVQHVEMLMSGEKPDMIFTDPPYGMNLDTQYRDMHTGGKNWKPVHGDDAGFDPGFLLQYFEKSREVFLWGADYYCQSLPKDGSWIVWDKRSSERDDITASVEGLDKIRGSAFELCWARESHKRSLARIVWAGAFGEGKHEERHGRNNAPTRFHPTQKPIGLVLWFFERWGKPNDLVGDLFLGSGSTLIACEKTGRRCFGMEIDPHYCDIIVKRWEKFTGKGAKLGASA